MGLFSKSKPAKPDRFQADATPTESSSSPSANGVLDDDCGTPIPPADPQLEARTIELGKAFLDDARDHKSGILSAAFWSDKLMDWSMKDQAFKVQMFRFVDTFPMLKTPEQIHDHFEDYMSQPGVTMPPGMGLAMKAGGLLKGVASKGIENRITAMAERFIAGTDAESALPALQKFWKQGIAFSVDLLGEACVSDEEAIAYQNKYLDLIDNLPATVAKWKPNERLETDHLGPIPRTNVSIKISSLYARTDPIDFEGSMRGLMETLVPILKRAKEKNVFINFDMEQFELKDLTLELFMRCCEEVDFEAGLAMQAYLRSGDDDARRVIEWSKRTGRQVSVRLVKGAYWDFETIHADEQGWPVPVWSRKIDTDACFERMATQFIQSTPRSHNEGGIKLALGSHNVRSIAHSLAVLEKNDLPINAIELQMLHGMADQLKAAAVERDIRIREYVPVGEMIPGMAYLVRRLLENTSNESWLKAGFLDNASPEELLASPHRTFTVDPGIQQLQTAPERHALSNAVEGVGDGRPFFTEPLRDFAETHTRDTFKASIKNASVPDVANDRTIDDVEEAVSLAQHAFKIWREVDPKVRANVLVKAAAIMRERRDQLSGIIIKENGKDWRNADADVTEAIDFCEYYARKAMPLFQYDRLGRFIGELDQLFYQPRGVCAVISPWNFPLAICIGMTAAALVTGNTVVVKPAEQTPGIAQVMCEILWEAISDGLRDAGSVGVLAAGSKHGYSHQRDAGSTSAGAASALIPQNILHFLPGDGETIGAALVRDPRISIIAFTGSKAVGLDIIKAAGITPDTQPFVKQVICEMGGKNAIIIDASADLDEAVLGVRASAFGFQGQKCSACSRAIVVDSAHDLFLHRLVESTRSLVIGDPLEPGTDVGPVIDEEAAAKIREYIKIGKSEGTLELGMDVPDGLEQRVGKPFVGPHIFSGIRPDHRLANEEVFGPVLAVIRVKDFDEALEVANATPYKLTGGLFSRKPAHLERVRREYRVGNLYLNRTITGALVGRQPFGGFGMSGIGSKAGGPEYLMQFIEPRAICENTMRRGFAPEL